LDAPSSIQSRRIGSFPGGSFEFTAAENRQTFKCHKQNKLASLSRVASFQMKNMSHWSSKREASPIDSGWKFKKNSSNYHLEKSSLFSTSLLNKKIALIKSADGPKTTIKLSTVEELYRADESVARGLKPWRIQRGDSPQNR